MIKLFFKTSSFKYFLPDWVFGTGLVVFFFFVVETAKPFPRKFAIDNPTLQYPFATNERVTDNELYFLSGILPALLIIGLSVIQKRRLQLSQADWLNLLSISILGLYLSFFITAVLTDILKVWIARPRPDFLARCGPKKGTDPTKLVGLEVCTAPLGEQYLSDGLKSTPSGHSSVSFAGLLYLSLWIIGQFKLNSKPTLTWKFLFPSLPLLLAVYIALSRTQDYRHHFFDIVFGGLIGISISFLNYFKLFPLLDSDSSNIAKVQQREHEKILP